MDATVRTWLNRGDYLTDAPAPTGPGREGVESPRFGIERCYPNPARALASVEYSLDSAESARLELIDVTGRVVLGHDLGAVGPGRHTVTIGPPAGSRPGVYWLRLRQAGRVAKLQAIFEHR